MKRFPFKLLTHGSRLIREGVERAYQAWEQDDEDAVKFLVEDLVDDCESLLKHVKRFKADWEAK